MANIRIRDLANLASSSASDDFLALDGLANGTRKLDAFSPTFGGNATVGGTLTVNGVGPHAFAGTININPSSGDVQQNFQRAGTGKGILSIPGTAGNIVADSAVDDLVVRTTSGKAFRVTTDGGSTSSLTVTTAAATFAKDVLLGTSGPSVPSTLSARAPRQGLSFDGTAAASLSGPTLGTLFTIAFTVRLTSLAAQTPLIFVNGGNFIGVRVTTGVLFYSGAASDFTSTVPINKTTQVVIVGNGTTATPYIDGVAGTPIAFTSSMPGVVNLGYIGNAALQMSGLATYNRALSAAEVKALYENGAPEAVDLPSQVAGTALLTGDNSTFASGAGNWVGVNGGSVSAGSGVLTVTSTGGFIGGRTALNIVTKGSRYRLQFTLGSFTGTVTQIYVFTSDGNAFSNPVVGTTTVEFTATATSYIGFSAFPGQSGTFTIDNVTLVPLGAVLAPDAAQRGAGTTWYDTSGNAANITLPASGVAWNVPSSSILNLVGPLQSLPTFISMSVPSLAGSDTTGGKVAWYQAGTGTVETGFLQVTQADGFGGTFTVGLNTTNTGTASPVFQIKKNGNTLIGTTTDGGQKLQVTGSIYASTDIVAQSALRVVGSATYYACLASGTALYYGFDNASLILRTNSANALSIDSSQNATFAKDILLGTSGPSVPSTLSGRAPRQGLVFDGTAAATASTVAAIGSGDYTVHVVFKAASPTSPLRLVQVGQAGVPQGFQFGTTDSAPAGRLVVRNGDASAQLFGNTVLTADKWYAATAVRSSGTTTIYLNAISDASGTLTTNYSNGIGGMTIHGSTGNYAGTVETALIYNRALSAAEVKALYENGVPAAADINNAGQVLPITGYNLTDATNLGGGSYQFLIGGNIFSTTNVVKKGRQYTAVFDVTAISGSTVLLWAGSSFLNTGITTTGLKSYTYTATGDGTFGLLSNGGTMTVGSIAPFGLGAVLAPDAAQTGGGLTWYDTSGNSANITLPASGVSWNVPTSGNVTSAGQLNLRAGGTNQHVYIAPSGTGTVRLGGTTTATLYSDSGLNLSIGTASGGAGLHFLSGSQAVLIGTTVNSSALLQVGTNTTTAAGGMIFGTDTRLYRSATNTLSFDTSGNAAVINVRESGTITAALGTVTGDLYLQTQQASKKVYIKTANAATAATFDENQNTTFAGTITTSAPTGGAGAWELGIANTVTPTAPNRTLTVEIGGTVYYIHAKTTND
jgi:hypothetical protein